MRIPDVNKGYENLSEFGTDMENRQPKGPSAQKSGFRKSKMADGNDNDKLWTDFHEILWRVG